MKRLEKIDGITFAYVSTKLKIPIGKKRAKSILEKNKNHSNVGLLIWCLGQNGYWNLLLELANDYSFENI